MTVRVRGVTETRDALAAVAGGLPPPDAARRAAEVIATDARKRAPHRTGALARSTAADGPIVGIGVRYGAPVHFGVPSRGQRAQPFLYQAAAAQADAVAAVYADDTQALIDEVV